MPAPEIVFDFGVYLDALLFDPGTGLLYMPAAEGGLHVVDTATNELVTPQPVPLPGFPVDQVIGPVGRFQPPCPWDCQAAPQSGAVDVPDLLALLGAWGGPQTPGTTCDLDGSGVINVLDLLEFLANWGPCP